MPASDSTVDLVPLGPRGRGGVYVRRASLAVLLIVVLVAATGLLGVHTETARASGYGYDLSVTYPRVARGGLDIPWELRLAHPGGFSGKITVALSADYYDIFEFQGMHPEPSAETATDEFVYLQFDPPKGDVFTTSLDTYVQPSAQLGRHAVVAVLMGGRKVAQVSYSTWLVP